LAGENLPRVELESRAALRSWLEENHRQKSSVWLVTFKKNDPLRYLAYGDIVCELLCFGWVDSLPRKLDETRSMLLISPRKATSNWSKVNRDKVERLTAAGLMTPAGMLQVEAAKADGRWTALDAAESNKPPADLVEAFERFPGSAVNFNAFPNSARRGILEWLMSAKRTDTRAKRVDEIARLAADNIRANQWRP
jgi:uncharacterized protein YdeI (YjbR/CyaY-like superfamily)